MFIIIRSIGVLNLINMIINIIVEKELYFGFLYFIIVDLKNIILIICLFKEFK